jgi:MFS family permease
VAVYGTLKDLLDAVYQYPGGWLADRVGRRLALVTFTALAIVGYVIYAVSPSWPWILVGTLFVMAWSSLTSPVIFAIIGDNLPQSGRGIGFGVQSALKRLPIVIAPPVGGWLVARYGLANGVKLGLLAAVALALLAIAIALRFYRERPVGAHFEADFATIWRDMDARLKRLLLADCLARLGDGVCDVFVVLYVINVLGASALDFGWLTSVQMITSITFYVPAAKLADRLNRKPFVLATFAFFALFPLAVAYAHGLAWLVVAFVLAGLREFGEPARKALIVDLAHASAVGRAVGAYYLVRGLVVFPASLVGGWLWTFGPQVPFIAAATISGLGFLAYARWGPGDAAPVDDTLVS